VANHGWPSMSVRSNAAVTKTPAPTHDRPSRPAALKVALVAGPLAHWGGGNDFLRLCAGGLWQQQTNSLVTFSVLLAGENPAQTIRRHLLPWKRMAMQVMKLERPRFSRHLSMRPEQSLDSIDSFGGELHTIVYRDRGYSNGGLIKILKRQGYDAAVPFAVSPGRFPLPWVGYIPDLQHKHHPEFFSVKECAARDLQFTQLLRDAKAIIVNSRDAKSDIDHFYPGYDCAIFTLPFAPVLNPEWLDDLSQMMVSRYRLPERYFLISNQFWAHKSHLTAFEALSKLGCDHAAVSLVCTGSTSDYRQPEYFPSLQRRIADLGLQSRILVLGRIPKHDQIQIMRSAVAVLQPTLFEGGPGGGAVYDAVCTGTPVILSDIPVNREVEIDDGSIQFFRAGSAADLAEQMRVALERRPQPPSSEELCRQSDQRAERLGSRLLEAIQYACKAAMA
jgi:glycosyltransferase involved in cell wall biosynthesis